MICTQSPRTCFGVTSALQQRTLQTSPLSSKLHVFSSLRQFIDTSPRGQQRCQNYCLFAPMQTEQRVFLLHATETLRENTPLVFSSVLLRHAGCSGDGALPRRRPGPDCEFAEIDEQQGADERVRHDSPNSRGRAQPGDPHRPGHRPAVGRPD